MLLLVKLAAATGVFCGLDGSARLTGSAAASTAINVPASAVASATAPKRPRRRVACMCDVSLRVMGQTFAFPAASRIA
ncbi:hypothetical protein G7085_07220 [Tessaracoccus sp. HDW20]|uniref:hypothetical protein n=1 Tax=Tessaracoccus coleopterorum TaxID=2714950 RepID=UPI0018D41C7C|nr:hypothetical protein [Tessaracoccus coleopterorum]NHB84465.1 hypothetical protein [Tessaracoccus coleopterorum]